MENPSNVLAIDDVKMATGFEIEAVFVSKDQIEREIDKFFGIKESVEKAIEKIEIPTFSDISSDELKSSEVDSPIIKIVDYLVCKAIKQNASDIHIDPQEDAFRIRFRIDGILQSIITPPKHAQNLLISRIKIMARMDITNKRMPQDGRISYNFASCHMDLRVSVVPTMFGEKMVLRLLYKDRVIFPLEKLGFQRDNYDKYIRSLKKNSGMILVTGPTGCGKTTTLYSTLSHLNTTEENIITIEDPVEYQLKEVNQIQINEKTGLTFAKGLRAILRQDPDIIMIGEIRDVETAKVAIRSALTGHLVFSTLHTNNVISTLFRFLDMGIPSYLIASSIEGVLSQRLIRLICQNCKVSYEPLEDELEIFKIYTSNSNFKSFVRGKGCRDCNNTGYRGRTAVYELLIINDELKEMLGKEISIKNFTEKAIDMGYIPLIKNAIKKVETGQTTLEEAIRVAF